MPASGGRACVSRSASEAVPLSSESIAAPIGSRSSDSPVISCCESVDRAGELVAVFGQRADHGVEVVDQLLHGLVVVGQRVGERRRLRQQRLQGSALALEDLHQRRGQRVDVLRIQALDDGFQPAEQQVEVQRRRGPVDRDLRPRGSSLRRSGTVDELEIAVADQVEIAHGGPGAGGEHDVAVGVELHQHLVVGVAARRR